eukprot:CAMPEP_0113616450 /NCGR_PEP_ID=MMETSP0017_2-20120614/8245_1 /TAXON_ID=2856 /ORGANISM="Cylindrotheca closterium" /LENGTH=247 /DNA_ID=CAMNT_0000525763 /DNA_START=91 /DNA_END=834 /DNA_ORIENTATION=+ /assembly_acc=CAM_ASM_000147
MQLEPNKLQISIPANAASRRLSISDAEDSQSIESTDLEFFQTCPLGSGFELDCWENKTPSVTEQTGTTTSMRGNSSFDDGPDDSDSGDDSSSLGSAAEQDRGYISANDDNSDNIPTTISGKEETKEEEDPNHPQVGNRGSITISASVQILEPHFQSAVDHISGRHVHFGATVVTTEYTYEKPSNEDAFRLYYSAHELQHLRDQYKIDVCTDKIHCSGPLASNILLVRADDMVDNTKQVDYCEDFPVW